MLQDLNNNTICAPATVAGQGAVAVIRVSGAEALDIVSKIFVSPKGRKLADMKGYTMCFGSIMKGVGEVLDDVVLSVYRAPHSYTGEDMVEISSHASPYIVAEILDLLVLYGCRKSRGALAAGFTAYCLYLGLVYGSYSHAFGVQKSVLSIPWMKHGSDVINLFFQVEFWAILALPLILIPMKSRWRVPKWISYGVYPFHLLVLGVIRHWSEIVAAVTSWIGSGTPPLS